MPQNVGVFAYWRKAGALFSVKNRRTQLPPVYPRRRIFTGRTTCCLRIAHWDGGYIDALVNLANPLESLVEAAGSRYDLDFNFSCLRKKADNDCVESTT